MGQGYSITTLSAGSAGIDVPELADLTHEKALGDARFMKSIRAKHRDGLVVAKVVMKPYASLRFAKYVEAILRERQILATVPNALGYHRALETSSNGYLIRQYVYSSIYDRLSTRPFLEDVEKKWLAFQLLCAVRDCHAKHIFHGDIKTENVLVTSWNWLYLTDFSSSFKPVTLPEDNPADFSFYFDISGRRTCYIAPERFLGPADSDPEHGVTWAMDIFSVGCVIAELFLETPIFSLSQLFNYRKKQYDPAQAHLHRIEDPDIRELVMHMISIDPESRFQAEDYLNFWRGKAFPEYFYTFLHQYMHVMTDPSSGRNPVTAAGANLGESDERIDRVYHDFDKISYLLGWDEVEQGNRQLKQHNSPNQFFPLHLDLPEKRDIVSQRKAPVANDGSLLFLSIVTSALRSTARATARVRACELLLAFGERVTDDAKMDRILPYLISLLQDSSDICKIAALRTLTQMLAIIPSTSPMNAYLFPEYILPRLDVLSLRALHKSSSLIRASYALCLATLAESASRFLDIVQALRAEGALPPIENELENPSTYAYRNLYDDARVDLIKFFERETKALLTDASADVRRAFLSSVSSLCVFFGTAKANDVILSHLNTFLNDRDWKLKCAFFETIVGVATYVGGTTLEEFILPLMIQASSDIEEAVQEKVLRSFATMAALGLFQRLRVWALLDLVARYMMHPNSWIREAAAHFIACASRYLSTADRECIVKPLLKPYFRILPHSLTELDILDALKTPLPRNVYELALIWIGKVDKGVFWKSGNQRHPATVLEDRMPALPAEDIRLNAFSRAPKNDEDNQWIKKLRNAGMTTADEAKFMALSSHIWRINQRKTREATINTTRSKLEDKVVLTDRGVNVQTIFFDQQLEESKHREALREKKTPNQRLQTIADALNEATAPVDTTEHGRSLDSDVQPSGGAGPKSSPRGGITWARPEMPTLERSPYKNPARSSIDTTDTASIMSSEDSISHQKHYHGLARKGSAISLMQRSTANAKASAETSMSDTLATGKVDAPHSKKITLPAPTKLLSSKDRATYRAGNSYSGRDPSVLKHLDGHALRSSSANMLELGPDVRPIHRRQEGLKPLNAPLENHAQPTGTLVTVFGEHTGPVRRVVVAPDHAFFVTSSDDGTVRIWDTSRLERNLAHKSRHVYRHSVDVKITSLCFVENSHCFVSTGSDGSVHVVRVDASETPQGVIRYGKLRSLRIWQLPVAHAHVVWCEHYKTEDQSTLILLTSTSQIYALDLRTMEILYVLENPAQHGMPTCFCLDSQKHSLLLGTTHGILDFWDLRFHILLRSWVFRGASPIHRILLHPSSQAKHPDRTDKDQEQAQTLVCIAGGSNTSDITIWNLNKATCELAFHSTPIETTLTSAPESADTKAQLNQTFTLDALWTLAPAARSARLSTLASTSPSLETTTCHDVHALTLGLAIPLSDPSNPARSTKKSEPFLVSAGPDQRIRYWNLARPQESSVVSGLAKGELLPEFVLHEPTTMGGVKVWKECKQFATTAEEKEKESIGGPMRATSSLIRSNVDTTDGDGRRKANVGARRSGESASTTLGDTARGTTGSKPTKKEKLPSMREQQEQLLKSHLDKVLDVAVLEWPTRMVVSVDRMGMIYVFQ